MAVRLPDGAFVDPFGGVQALAARILDTPLDPEVSFCDDPLRMLRAARFVAQLGVRPAPRVLDGDRRDARPARDRLGRADPRRARQAAGGRARRGGPRAPRRDRGSPRCSCRSCPRSASSRTRCTGTRTCCATRTRWSSGAEPRPRAAAGRAAARHRQAGDARDHRRGRDVPPPRGRRRADGPRAARRRCATRRRSIDDVCTLIELHLRFHGYGEGVDRRRRSPVRPRRRPAARRAEPADARRRDHAEREARRGFRAAPGRARGADRGARRAGEPRGDAAAARRSRGDGASGLEPGPAVGEALAYLMELRLERGPVARTRRWRCCAPGRRERRAHRPDPGRRAGAPLERRGVAPPVLAGRPRRPRARRGSGARAPRPPRRRAARARGGTPGAGRSARRATRAPIAERDLRRRAARAGRAAGP